MHNYIFLEKTIAKNHNIIFLCGVKYTIDEQDKRNVLKKFLHDLDSKNNIIILEENFIFGKSNKNKLSYDDIFMNDLNSVETLTALFSDLVFIIHESNSTAAELGIFATNEILKDKLCLLVPDEFSVEENKISSFLYLAFFRKKSDIKKIVFYPSTEVWRSSVYKSNFKTRFLNDEIGQNLAKNIQDVIKKQKTINPNIKIVRAKFNKHSNDIDVISYMYNRLTRQIDLSISGDIIKWQVISLFNIDEFRTEIRKNKTISEHVTYLVNFYKEALKNTLEYKEGYSIDKVNIIVKGTTLNIRNIVAYLLYLLQAMNKIEFIQEGEDPYIRKIRIDNDFNNLYKLYCDFVVANVKSTFGGISS